MSQWKLWRVEWLLWRLDRNRRAYERHWNELEELRQEALTYIEQNRESVWRYLQNLARRRKLKPNERAALAAVVAKEAEG